MLNFINILDTNNLKKKRLVAPKLLKHFEALPPKKTYLKDLEWEEMQIRWIFWLEAKAIYLWKL